MTLESVDVAESVRFFREFLGLDAESYGHYFFSRGNDGVNVIGVQVAVMEYPQPLLNHHGITLYSGREELIDGLRQSAEANAQAFGVMKILPATYQHGSYSFYLQDRDTNWWEIEILEELDPYEQTLKDGESDAGDRCRTGSPLRPHQPLVRLKAGFGGGPAWRARAERRGSRVPAPRYAASTRSRTSDRFFQL